MNDVPADPFAERGGRRFHRHYWLLGARFDFESDSRQLLALVDQAFAGLPAHRLEGARRCRIRLVLGRTPHAARLSRAPSAPRLSAGAGLLCAVMDAGNFAVVDPREASALIVAAPSALRFPYYLRYELIEFAVQTLAARSGGLVPLHAACLASRGRAVLLVGDSGTGKSTLCLHALIGGLEIVSEDSVFVAARGRKATGLASFLHLRSDSLAQVKRGTAAELRRAPTIRRRSGVSKLEVDLRRRFALALRPPRIEAVVFLSRRRRRGALLVALSAPAMLRRLRALQPYAVAAASWPAFERSLRGVAAFELGRGAHPAASVDALRTFLESAD